MHTVNDEPIVDAAKASSEVFDAITRAATDRHISMLSSAGKQMYESVAQWFATPDEKHFLAHSMTSTFKAALKKAPIFPSTLPCYRGRSLLENEIPTTAGLGPPPQCEASAGRYNKAKQPVLYLASTQDGVDLETRDSTQSHKPLYSQSFLIPAHNFKLVDCSNQNTDPLITMAFDCCERTSKDTYPKSQELAMLIKNAGYDGFITQGVHGSRKACYRNIIIFNYKDWRNWTIGSPGLLQRKESE